MCVDKTGTITENEMKVDSFDLIYDGISKEEMALLIGDMAQSQNSDNITMAALQAYFDKTSGRHPNTICPFSSKYKYCGASYSDGNFVLGAPEFVLREDLTNLKSRLTVSVNRAIVFWLLLRSRTCRKASLSRDRHSCWLWFT